MYYGELNSCTRASELTGHLARNDDERKNLNGTIYRNQLNKVALAIKEIISGLKKEPIELNLGEK